MRLSRVAFHAYKRLLDTSCTVEGRIVAFLGPNEAGKSSVLEGLRWLTAGDGQPLPGHLRARGGQINESKATVRAEFDLDADDLEALSGITFEGVPKRFILARHANGEVRTGTTPAVTRPVEPLTSAVAELERLRAALVLDPTRPGELSLVERALELLDGAEAASDVTELSAVLSDIHGRWQRDSSEPAAGEEPLPLVADSALLQAVDAARSILGDPDPYAAVRSVLRQRAPRFLLFSEPDRVLESEYNLSDDAFRGTPPAALANLLRVAGTDVHELWALASGGDLSALKTRLRRCNEQIQDRLTPTWRQSKITVELGISGSVLQVFVEELEDDGRTVVISERSDGLKTFIALVSFLAVQDHDGSQPILLIDEAETHLHYDAQADLVEVLMEHIDAAKVLYTTHSPGCLPFDLGTGVRLVAPDAKRRDVSTIRHDFWQANEPGFTPLLFAMGAGAAAFSVCRAAVLAEGASDMILAPTLIRMATGKPFLRYQVAPGLALLPRTDVGQDVAAHLAYLLDGDASGRDRRKNLASNGISDDRIYTLDESHTIEDLIEAASYVAAVNAVLDRLGRPDDHVTLDQLNTDVGIVQALKTHFEPTGRSVPSRVAVADYLVGDPENRIALTQRGRQSLTDMHALFEKALEL